MRFQEIVPFAATGKVDSDSHLCYCNLSLSAGHSVGVLFVNTFRCIPAIWKIENR